MTDVERVAEALWRNNFPNDNRGEYPTLTYPQLIEPTKDDLRDMARAAIAALGPQLTAGEAKAAMLGLEEIWKDFLPHTLESSSLDDAENAYRKLSLIADEEKP